MVVVLGPVMAEGVGAHTIMAPGLVTEEVLGAATVALRGAGTIAAIGVDTVTDFTTGAVFLVQVLASLATVTRGIIRAIPIILIPPRTMAIPTMDMGTTAIRITAIRPTKIPILARRASSHFRPHSHDEVTIAVQLMVSLGRRLAMPFDHSRRIGACR
jgi:hypothetical protein